MKNQHDVCMAKDAGFVEFTGLLGSIKTGCQRTSAFKSRYCLDHLNHACTYQADDAGSGTEEGIVEVLLAKKVTRSTTYYQVYHICMKCVLETT